MTAPGPHPLVPMLPPHPEVQRPGRGAAACGSALISSVIRSVPPVGGQDRAVRPAEGQSGGGRVPRRTEKQGVRIPWVTDSRGDRYDVSEIDRQTEPRYVAPLKCGGCGTRVSALHGNADNPDTRTSHYFRIDPHTAACRCDLDQRGKQLAGSLAAPPPAVSTGPPGEQLAPGGSLAFLPEAPAACWWIRIGAPWLAAKWRSPRGYTIHAGAPGDRLAPWQRTSWGVRSPTFGPSATNKLGRTASAGSSGGTPMPHSDCRLACWPGSRAQRGSHRQMPVFQRRYWRSSAQDLALPSPS